MPSDATLRSPIHTPVQPALRAPEPEVGADADQRLLEVAQVEVQVALVAREREDRVADELARPVVGDVAAALDLEDGDVAGGDDVGAATTAAARA